MDISAIALQGMEKAETLLGNTANKVANTGTSPGGANLDTVDLSKEMVALMTAATDFSANASVLKTADQMEKQTTDLIA
jgi:flagellar hook protein FlgE